MLLPSTLRTTSIVIACGVVSVGCGDRVVSEGRPGQPSPDKPQGEVPTLPTLDEGWSEIATGGETICSRGTDYAFFVNPGTVNRVVIDFIGGGACWNAQTCSFADAIFNPDIENIRAAIADDDPHGFYEREREENPFRDWYHVVIPYCTGDIHWGNNVATYGEGDSEVVINHKGAINSQAVLDWVYDNFSAPEQVFVTGCSAGSYGSAMWAPHVMDHYQDSHVIQFGDSGAGIITQNFFEESFPSWKAESTFPTWIPELDPEQNDLYEMSLGDLYVAVANHYPEHQTSQYNTAFDNNQVFYFQAMGGGDEQAWSEQMHASIADIEARADSFVSFIPSGDQHCILGFDNFYSVNIGDDRLVDWLAAMVDEVPIESVACTTDCTAPTP